MRAQYGQAMTSTMAPVAPAHDLLALPASGRFNDPAAQGRLAALRTFTDAMTTVEGRNAYTTTVTTVVLGPAPAAFKDAFEVTMNDLHATFAPSQA